MPDVFLRRNVVVARRDDAIRLAEHQHGRIGDRGTGFGEVERHVPWDERVWRSKDLDVRPARLGEISLRIRNAIECDRVTAVVGERCWRAPADRDLVGHDGELEVARHVDPRSRICVVESLSENRQRDAEDRFIVTSYEGAHAGERLARDKPRTLVVDAIEKSARLGPFSGRHPLDGQAVLAPGDARRRCDRELPWRATGHVHPVDLVGHALRPLFDDVHTQQSIEPLPKHRHRRAAEERDAFRTRRMIGRDRIDGKRPDGEECRRQGGDGLAVGHGQRVEARRWRGHRKPDRVSAGIVEPGAGVDRHPVDEDLGRVGQTRAGEGELSVDADNERRGTRARKPRGCDSENRGSVRVPRQINVEGATVDDWQRVLRKCDAVCFVDLIGVTHGREHQAIPQIVGRARDRTGR